MKKNLLKIMALLTVLCCVLCLAACSDKSDKPSGSKKPTGSQTGNNENNGNNGNNGYNPPEKGILNLNDYVLFEQSGSDLCGTVSNPRFDIDALMEACFDRIYLEPMKYENCCYFYDFDYNPYAPNPGECTYWVEILDPKAATEEMFRQLLPEVFLPGLSSNYTNLSNGDTVTVSYAVGQEKLSILSRIVGCDILYEETGVTVQGFTPLKEYDPFHYVYLYFTGNNGSGKLEYKEGVVYLPTPDGDFEQVKVDVEIPANNGQLSNGDTVHVKFKNTFNEAYIAQTMGIKLTRQEADYVIHGLNAYGQPSAAKGEAATINLADYIYVNFINSRLETYAQLQFMIDYDRLFRDYHRSTNSDLAPEDLYGYEMAYGAAQKLLSRSHFPVTFSTSTATIAPGWGSFVITDVKNGDVVVLDLNIDATKLAKLQKVMNITIDTNPISYTVSGLTPLTTVDVFQNCEITFTGANGSGAVTATAYMESTATAMTLHFEVVSGNNGTLSNGDKVVFRVKDSELQLLASHVGFIPQTMEYEVTVSGLA